MPSLLRYWPLTFPDQVAIADYWLQQNKALSGQALMQTVNAILGCQRESASRVSLRARHHGEESPLDTNAVPFSRFVTLNSLAQRA
jgi:hypothetical protein